MSRATRPSSWYRGWSLRRTSGPRHTVRWWSFAASSRQKPGLQIEARRSTLTPNSAARCLGSSVELRNRSRGRTARGTVQASLARPPLTIWLLAFFAGMSEFLIVTSLRHRRLWPAQARSPTGNFSKRLSTPQVIVQIPHANLPALVAGFFVRGLVSFGQGADGNKGARRTSRHSKEYARLADAQYRLPKILPRLHGAAAFYSKT